MAAYYGKIGGCLVTGNKDGVKPCAMNIVYSLRHVGYVIPPQETPTGSARPAPVPPTSTAAAAVGKVRPTIAPTEGRRRGRIAACEPRSRAGRRCAPAPAATVTRAESPSRV